jgi:hypothetical protein
MKPLGSAVFLVLLFAIPRSNSQPPLRHRAYLGFGYRPVTRAQADSLGLPDADGLVVNRVMPGSPAEKAGLRPGDVLRRFDETPVTDQSRFRDLLRRYFAGDTVRVQLFRDGKLSTVRIRTESLPEEKSGSVDIEYTSFSSGGVRLRAVLASPLTSAGKPLPAVLLVSALGSPQLIGIPFYSMTRDLAYAMAGAGFRVLRFELRGSGDSEGEDYRTTDFDSEVEDNLAALDYLAGRKDVDPERVFVYGHSTGGMEAAVIAGRRDLAGLLVSCTVGRTYFERMAETVRLQSRLEGESAAETADDVRRYLLFTAAVARGDSLPILLRRHPEFKAFVNAGGRIMDDRTAEFWRQQLELNLPHVYGAVAEPVLIVYAASDFLTSIACHEHIRDVLTASGNRDVTLEVIPNTDHAYAFAGDFKESFDHYHAMNYKGNPEAAGRIVAWLRRH